MASPSSIKSQTHSSGLQLALPNPIYWVLNLLAAGCLHPARVYPLVLRVEQKIDVHPHVTQNLQF